MPVKRRLGRTARAAAVSEPRLLAVQGVEGDGHRVLVGFGGKVRRHPDQAGQAGCLGGHVPGGLAELEGAHVEPVRGDRPVIATRLGLHHALEERVERRVAGRSAPSPPVARRGAGAAVSWVGDRRRRSSPDLESGARFVPLAAAIAAAAAASERLLIGYRIRKLPGYPGTGSLQLGFGVARLTQVDGLAVLVGPGRSLADVSTRLRRPGASVSLSGADPQRHRYCRQRCPSTRWPPRPMPGFR